MKLTANQNRRQAGTIITVIMCCIAIAGIILGSYFSVVQNQSAAVARTQAWNTGISVSEAGIEEGFGLINRVLPASGSTGWEWTNSVALVNDGWSVMDSNSTTLTRTGVSAGSYTVKVTLPTSGTNRNPIIVSTATVPHTVYPWIFGGLNLSVGAPTVNLVRKVQVTTTRAYVFPVAIASVQQITLAGGSTVDSFDSTSSNYSTGGLYDPLKSKDNANVATDASVAKSITGGGNIKIKGSVVTGPGGTSSLSGIASVGDAAWVNAGTSGIEDGHGRDDMNVNFLNVYAPTNLSWVAPTTSIMGGTNVTLLSGPSGTPYIMTSINLSSTDKILITGTDVVLYVTGNVKLSGTSSIELAPGASVKVYIDGNVNMSGQGLVNPGAAINFQVYGSPSCHSFGYAGSADFTGTIYAPQADFRMTGGASFVGATVTQSYTSSGGGSFHYDESLGSGGPLGPFVANTWQEIK